MSERLTEIRALHEAARYDFPSKPPSFINARKMQGDSLQHRIYWTCDVAGY